MNDLRDRHCQALTGVAMDDGEIRNHLAKVEGWTLADGAIERSFRFDNYHQTMAFVNALAWISHVEDHHPDLSVSYGRCVVRYNTHSVNGISINDFICAAKADALVAVAR